MSVNVVVVADTHSHSLPKILEGYDADLLLIGGDWSYKATPQEIRNFTADLKAVRPQFKQIVWINGNHELGMEYNLAASYNVAEETNTIHLHNEEIELDFDGQKVRIWGSPATPWFGGWAYNYQRGKEIAEIWKNIPEGLGILLVHGPVHGCLDYLPWSEERVGCEELRKKIDSMDAPPKVICHGHVHIGYGSRQLATEKGHIVQIHNAAICTERYDPTNLPIRFYL